MFIKHGGAAMSMEKGLLLAIGMCLLSEWGYTDSYESGFFRVHSAETSTMVSAEGGWLEWTPDGETTGAVSWVVETSSMLTHTTDWRRWTSVLATSDTVRVHAVSFSAPPDMAFIPGGLFRMGDVYGDLLRDDELPAHDVDVDAFFIARTPVTLALWQDVYAWATSNSYTFAHTGSGKDADHPVHTITWQDAVKWCNARSEMEGFTPSYYYMWTGTLHVYRSGFRHLTNAHVNWNAGYRLPTEAEWEKAARGGYEGFRYPWGDTISHAVANYRSSVMEEFLGDSSHDGLPANYHPAYASPPTPYTSPVGSFAPNGYGVYDTVDNIGELCWDRYASNYYSVTESVNPRGPDTGAPFANHRSTRGGGWNGQAYYNRLAYRYYQAADTAHNNLGFRVVLPVE